MNNNCLDKLEYIKILEKLNSFAKTYIGKKLVNDLTPSFDAIEVANLQLQTSQALDMINKYGNPPIGEFNVVSIHLKKLSGDSILSTKEILDLASILKMSRELSLFFDEVSENVNFDFNILKPFFNNLYINLDLEKEIEHKIEKNKKRIYTKVNGVLTKIEA